MTELYNVFDKYIREHPMQKEELEVERQRLYREMQKQQQRNILPPIMQKTIARRERPAPPPPLPQKELVAGPVLGYRIWRLKNTQDGVRLQAAGQSTLWQPGIPLIAHCSQRSQDGPPPHPNRCGCGIYAMRLVEDIPVREYGDEGHTVVGQVGLWGRVIEHEHGYRGQYAYPLAIWPTGTGAPLPPGFPVKQRKNRHLEKIAEMYGCQLLEGPVNGPR